MLLINKEQVMKIPENYMMWGLIIAGGVLLFIAFCCSKSTKAVALAYALFP